MGPKKSGLTPEQQATYSQVLKNLHNQGALGKAAVADNEEEKPAAEAPLKRRKSKKSTEDVSTTAASESGSTSDAAKASPTESCPKPKARTSETPASKAPTPKSTAKAATPKQTTTKKQPASQVPEACEAAEPCTKKAKTAAKKTSAPAPKAPAPSKPTSFWDENLQVTVSWENFDEVCKKVLAKYPDESRQTVAMVLTNEIGDPPAWFSANGLQAGEERHPGPVLRDPCTSPPNQAKD